MAPPSRRPLAAAGYLILPAAIMLLGILLMAGARDFGARDALGLQGWPPALLGVGEALAGLGLAWFGARAIDLLLVRRLGRAGRPPPRLIGDLVRVVLFGIAAVVLVAQLIGQPVGGVLATSGVVIAVVGFALRHTLTDIVSGIALGVEGPFRIGDWVRLADGSTGRVEEISWRASRLRTKDDVAVTVPNGLIAGQVLHNYSQPEPRYRASLSIDLDVAVPVDRARRVLLGSALRTDRILDQPPPDVVLEDTGEAGVRYRLRYWVGDYADDIPCRDAVLRHALDDLGRAGLAPAPPRRRLVRPAADETDNARRHRLVDGCPLFGAFTPEERAALADRLKEVAVPAGGDAVTMGDAGRTLFLVAEGLLDVLKPIDGEATVIDRMVPGDVFGEVALLTGEPRSATVRATIDTRLYAMDPEALEPLMRARPSLADSLGALMADRQAHNRRRAELTRVAAESAGPASRPEGIAARIRRVFGL